MDKRQKMLNSFIYKHATASASVKPHHLKKQQNGIPVHSLFSLSCSLLVSGYSTDQNQVYLFIIFYSVQSLLLHSYALRQSSETSYAPRYYWCKWRAVSGTLGYLTEFTAELRRIRSYPEIVITPP